MSERGRYRTIVADPPWQIADYGARTLSTAGFWREDHTGQAIPVPYAQLSLEEIASLPVGDLAETDAHLYLWTINAYVCEAYDIARAWGFKPSTLLTWCKEPRGLGFGGSFVNTTEFILFARRGSLPALRRWESTWFSLKRPYVDGKPAHSRKPDGLQDIVEQVSPGPYLELFARRQRLGWDTWGDEALEHVTMNTDVYLVAPILGSDGGYVCDMCGVADDGHKPDCPWRPGRARVIPEWKETP